MYWNGLKRKEIKICRTKFFGMKNTCYEIYNPYSDISPLEPCDAPKMKKYRPKDDRCTNKQIAKRRKKNKNRKTHRRK